jgi:hypothetical protein
VLLAPLDHKARRVNRVRRVNKEFRDHRGSQERLESQDPRVHLDQQALQVLKVHKDLRV